MHSIRALVEAQHCLYRAIHVDVGGNLRSALTEDLTAMSLVKLSDL